MNLINNEINLYKILHTLKNNTINNTRIKFWQKIMTKKLKMELELLDGLNY